MALDSTAEKLSKLGIDWDLASSAPNLQKNIHLLSPEHVPIGVENIISFLLSLRTEFMRMVLIAVADSACEDSVGIGTEPSVPALD